ncbi:hypothetical protein Q1695_003593 [Nippostrongylus brasiliensis]|nr:hypothetical protein Q1695_003593 [Nippostrongylus brasiliensis]
MNLTLDCGAVNKASSGAYLRLYGKPDNLNKEKWCLYGATSWTWVSDSTNVVDTLVRDINFDKVAQTALLHRQTKYGCAAGTVVRTTLTSRWEDHGLLCIYEKKAPQDLCTIDCSRLSRVAEHSSLLIIVLLGMRSYA